MSVQLCSRVAACFAGAMMLLPLAASADPIEYSVDALLSMGGTLSGTFDYNAATNTYSDVEFTVSLDGSAGAPTWDTNTGSVVNVYSSSTYLNVANSGEHEIVWLSFAAPLSIGNDTLAPIETSYSIGNANEIYNFNNESGDYIVSGDVIAEDVPEPASLAILGTGVLAFGFFGWRRRGTI
jgi:PEP-CTERM motif